MCTRRFTKKSQKSQPKLEVNTFSRDDLLLVLVNVLIDKRDCVTLIFQEMFLRNIQNGIETVGMETHPGKSSANRKVEILLLSLITKRNGKRMNQVLRSSIY